MLYEGKMSVTWFILLIVVPIIVAFAFTPRDCATQGNIVTVHTLARDFKYNLDQAIDVEPIPAEQVNSMKTVRLFGVGWPLKPYGWFRNNELGTFLALVNDSQNMWLIKFKNKQVVVSPKNSRDMVMYLEQRQR